MISDQTRGLARLHLDVALALYQARERANLSVEAIAELSGLSPARIVIIEEGDTTSLTEVALLCHALGIAIASVLPEDANSEQFNRHGSILLPAAS